MQQPITTPPPLTPGPKKSPQWLSLLKKFWFVAVMIFLLLVAVVLRLLTPPTPEPVVEEIEQTEIPTTIGSLPANIPITYTGSPIQLPEKLNLYQAEVLSLEATAEYMAGLLNLQQQELFPTLWLSEDSQQSLSLLVETGILEYIVVPPVASGSAKVESGIEAAAARSAARDFLAELGLNNNATLSNTGIKYFNDELQPEEVEPTAAKFASIPFFYTLDSIPLAMHGSSLNTTRVMVNSSLNVTKVVFTPLLTNPTVSKTLAPLSIEAAVKQIQSGDNIVTNVSDPNTVRVIELTDLTSIQLTNVSLQYRYHRQSSTVVPYFNFTGKGQTKQGRTIDIEILTPAITE